MAKLTPIDQITPDIDPIVVRVVFNPLNVDFVHKFAGRAITLKAGIFTPLPSPVARHMAKHLAIKMRHENVMNYLETNIKGMNEDSIEKWKRETKFIVTKDDVNILMDQVLFNSEAEAHEKFGMAVEQPDMAKEEETDVLASTTGKKQPSADDVASQIKERAQAAKAKSGAKPKAGPKTKAPVDEPEDEEDEDAESEDAGKEDKKPKSRADA